MDEAATIFLFYGTGAIIMITLCVLFYLRSVSTRKAYHCGQCGESFKTELMEASHCNHCGAPLK